MKCYYANLLGKWTDITKDGLVENCNVPAYFEDNLNFEDGKTVAKCFEFGYVNVTYGERSYRIDPSCIQIVTE